MLLNVNVKCLEPKRSDIRHSPLKRISFHFLNKFIEFENQKVMFCLAGLPNTSARSQLNSLLQMMHGLVDCMEPLRGYVMQLRDTELETSVLEEGETISSIVEGKLQYVLLQLTKVYTTMHSKKRFVLDKVLIGFFVSVCCVFFGHYLLKYPETTLQPFRMYNFNTPCKQSLKRAV